LRARTAEFTSAFRQPTGFSKLRQLRYTRSTVRVDEFDYHLPPDRIAQRPLPEREASKLLLLDRATGVFADSSFVEFPELLRGDELLVFNNARVIPARLFGRRAALPSEPASRPTAPPYLSGAVEVFLTRRVSDDTWDALVSPGRKLPVGEKVFFGGGELQAEIISRGQLGLRTVKFSSQDGQPIPSHLERLGHVPLPPYIKRDDENSDRERYQTVFAKKPGAIAAPTAGLHFSPAVMARIRDKGIETCELTLDVGLGTFQPIHAEILAEHVMHGESYEISPQTAAAISSAHRSGRPVLAVGTTVVRALEDSAQRAAGTGARDLLVSGRAEASIFITPGYEFKVANGLLTNFHLPKSTLLVLVSAFAGFERVLAAYRHAVENGYRFFSYGDCMLIR
jgi:S-adenosylmethionine:tRNA ribosyltransferase-isomerase